jgi:hypothetical protein
MKKIPTGIMHKPKTMIWAELTPLKEHKEREEKGVEIEGIETTPTETRKEPLPISRATTDLRRAYPYIFDCAAYAKTHNPKRIITDNYYSRFEMPYSVFLDYCLDYCTEQTDYLKNEIYKLMNGQKAKRIKVSKDKTVYGWPVIVTFSHTELKTGKEKRIENIGADAKVDMVQIQILKELLDTSHGYGNVPKAFYAKTRHYYSIMRENVHPVLESKDDYRKLINQIKKMSAGPIGTEEAAHAATTIVGQAQALEKLAPEQGGFYPVYSALEYILANKKGKASFQIYGKRDI